jgi:3-deoxy-7-phosphoheptulonate synthase
MNPSPESDSLNTSGHSVLITPAEIKTQMPLSVASKSTVLESRHSIEDILDSNNERLILIVGPCSVHDIDSALEYSRRLKSLAKYVEDTIVIVMRVYLEKPRTTVGWKGLISDPRLDGSCKVEEGLLIARDLLLQITGLGLPVATEALDPINASYLSDLVSWYAIGARTTESQVHRELASGLPAPVGFKNSTDGGLDVAINSIIAASAGQGFRGIDEDGRTAVLDTNGNKYGHIVLRGGERPNYDPSNIRNCEKKLQGKNLPVNIIVDCSHDNSNKDPYLQPSVARDCVSQICEGNTSIIGLMIESNLHWGRQDIPKDTSLLKYGVSVTDACLDWQSTEELISEIHKQLRANRRVLS